MIKVEKFVFNSFQENTYLLFDETKECIIIDAGCYDTFEKERIVKFIDDNNLKLVKLVITHGHVDHVLGLEYLSKKYNLTIEMHEEDIKLLKNVESYGGLYGFEVEGPKNISANLIDGGSISFGNSRLNILHVPGHSPGSIALHSPIDNFVIVGDVLFKGSIGRTDLPGGDYDILMNSIGSKLMTLDENTMVYSGHMGETTIGIEKRSNPFITEFFGTF